MGAGSTEGGSAEREMILDGVAGRHSVATLSADGISTPADAWEVYIDEEHFGVREVSRLPDGGTTILLLKSMGVEHELRFPRRDDSDDRVPRLNGVAVVVDQAHHDRLLELADAVNDLELDRFDVDDFEELEGDVIMHVPAWAWRRLVEPPKKLASPGEPICR